MVAMDATKNVSAWCQSGDSSFLLPVAAWAGLAGPGCSQIPRGVTSASMSPGAQSGDHNLEHSIFWTEKNS